MKILVPAFIIGIVGGMLDSLTELNKVWCFLIGLAAFFLFVFVKSVFTTAKIMKQTKGADKIFIDQNNNVVDVNNE